MKNIAILGSTGSIGTQALSVISEFPENFRVSLLTSRNNLELLARQARQFLPDRVIISNTEKYRELKGLLEDTPVEVGAGEEALQEAVSDPRIDLVLSALVGYAGLKPTLNALESGKQLALANKETMVIAGDLVNRLADRKMIRILPVDSEHSAIFQCLVGEEGNPVEKLILTASGGPFLGKKKEYLEQVSPSQALNHPNWSMGNKITIDCATLMNKGLEAIEARWLFRLDPEQIEVTIHPQSIVHSMVCFEDGSVKAQMSLPDMRLPILYALAYPRRLKSSFPRYTPQDFPELNFAPPDLQTFRNLALAYEAMKMGGNAPCVLNGANEVAVEAFLAGKVRFTGIPGIIEHALGKVPHLDHPGLDDYMHSDREARSRAREMF